MKFLKSLIVLSALALPALSWAAPRVGFLTIGPMLHWNFGGSSYHSFSWGVEGAYWSYQRDDEETLIDPAPLWKKGGYGMCVGFDIGGGAYRLYVEPEIGWMLAGLSVGPVLEFAPGKAPALGLQASAWANMLLGVDFRYRRIRDQNFQALGLYAKLPVPAEGDVDP